MAVYATLEEMAVLRPDGIPEEDEARAEALLAEASVLVEECAGRFWDLEGDLLADPPILPEVPPSAIKSVTIQVALRMFDNPQGFSLELLGPWSGQRPQSNVTGMELTRSEKARVRRAVGKASAGTIATPID